MRSTEFHHIITKTERAQVSQGAVGTFSGDVAVLNDVSLSHNPHMAEAASNYRKVPRSVPLTDRRARVWAPNQPHNQPASKPPRSKHSNSPPLP